MPNRVSRPANVQRHRLDEHPPEEVIGDDEPGKSIGNPVILDDDDESHDDRAHNSANCRICFGQETDTYKGPLVFLGCKCKNEMSMGHMHCLLQWYKPRLSSILEVDCEVCRGTLGKTLLSSLLAFHRPGNARPFLKPSEIILIQIPVEELDGLHVPIDTPAFDTLNRQTRFAIKQCFRTEVSRYKRRRVLTPAEMAPLMNRDEDGRRGRVKELLREYIDMVMVKMTPQAIRPEKFAFFPRRGGPPNIRIILRDGIGDILRVPASGDAQAAVLPFSRELACNWDLLGGSPEHETYILLPRFMIHVDDIYMEGRNGPAAGPSAPASDRRQFTYGRYLKLPFRPLW